MPEYNASVAHRLSFRQNESYGDDDNYSLVLPSFAEAFGLLLRSFGLVIFRHLAIPQQLPYRLRIKTEHPGRATG
jgi:hypothetical protein